MKFDGLQLSSAKQKRGLKPHFQFAKRKRGLSLRSATQVR